MATRPKLSVSFTSRDLGMGHFLKEAEKLRKKPFVKAGVNQKKGSKLHTTENQKGEKKAGVKTVADIAAIHEFGAEKKDGTVIPERSFLRSTKSKNITKYNTHLEHLGAQIFNADSGMTTERMLGLIGQEYIADVKNTIRAGIAPALAASTIRAKNAAHIAKAMKTAAHLTAKGDLAGYRAAQKSGAAFGPVNRGAYHGKLSEGDRGRLHAAAEMIITGGQSTPLIDTAQMINSLTYEVVLDGTAAKGDTVESMAAKGKV